MEDLYAYQNRVRKALLIERRNVILQAPTGTGKTRAALLPFFENLERYGDDGYPAVAPLPLTCRYAVPMRVLANQFLHEHRNYFGNLDRNRGTRFQDIYTGKLGMQIPAIQTGEQAEDTRFEAPLTFCTIDQLLASFIGAPYSVGHRQANLNVGAVVGSYLVLDEFHLYPLDERFGGGARTTTLAMLRLLNNFRHAGFTLAPFTLMTATFSKELLEQLGELLDAVVVRVEGDELPNIMKGRERTIRRANEPMSPDAILAAHDAAHERGMGASLVVCNTVVRAQTMYMRLREALAQRTQQGDHREIRLELLHSRFTPDHRKKKSEDLENWLGKAQWDSKGRYLGEQDTIIVGTQVIEVGLDISAGALHTELAPASSIIQRAGRCARFDNQHGEVIVYPIAPRDDGKVSHLPYDEKTCAATWEALEAMRAEMGASAATGIPFGFGEEQRLIDLVHTEEDKRFLDTFRRGEDQVQRAIMETLATHDRGKTGDLIRNVKSVSILVHAAPEEGITVKPFTWESFSLHPDSVRGALTSLEQRKERLGAFDGPGWLFKQLIPDPGVERREDDNDRDAHYTWDTVSREAIPLALRLAIHPQLAAYDDEVGFRFLTPDDPEIPEGQWYQSKPDAKLGKRPHDPNDWRQRTQRSYVEHISGLMGAYDWSVRRELAWVAARLEMALGAPTETLDEAIRLAIACHDIGKLNISWQRWAHATQQALHKTYSDPKYLVAAGRAFLAKTDGLESYRWKEERGLQQSLPVKKPNHACAGVVASMRLIGQRMLARTGHEGQAGAGALAQAALSAIARHHTSTATEYDAVAYTPAARTVIAEALTACRLPADADTLGALDLAPKPTGNVSEHTLVHPDAERVDGLIATWLGFTLVRALRLCDQRAEYDW